MKILTVIGARPQFIKAAVVSRAISKFSDICEVIVHTGQHYDPNMSSIFFEQMGIPRPNYQLETGGALHGAMTGRQLEKIEEIMLQELPDLVIVYGDTNSTLAGALAASKLHIPIAHIEAGLRSFNRRMPEEINRVLTDHISSLLFVPTESARQNLKNEGIDGFNVCVVGDVMYDAALFYTPHAVKPVWFDGYGLVKNNYTLCTIHRAENTDDHKRLGEILKGIGASGLTTILPLHPRTKKQITHQGIVIPENIHIVEPVGFLEMVWLELHSFQIATDSGGVQKEAFFHNKRCITFRDETEWVELVEAGVNTLVGANSDHIKNAFIGRAHFPDEVKHLYGDGDAGEKIIKYLLGFHKGRTTPEKI